MCTCSMHILNLDQQLFQVKQFDRYVHNFSSNRVPTGSGKQGKQGKNNGQGKLREFCFGPKVREKSGNFVLNCRLP